MRILVKSQEEQHQLNAAMLQSLIDLHRKIDSRWGTARPEGSKSSTRRRTRNSSGQLDSEESSGDTSSSSHKKRRRHHRDHSWDEFKKAKPPIFDHEIKTGQEAEAWLLGIKKYFPSSGLFWKHEGKGCHIQSEWKGIHLVGEIQASKKDQ